MTSRVLFNTIAKAMEHYPKLRWSLADGYLRIHLWHDDRGLRFREEFIFPPDQYRGHHTVVCSVDDGEQELSVRQDISNRVADEISGDQFRRHVLDRMATELAVAFFKRRPGAETATEAVCDS